MLYTTELIAELDVLSRFRLSSTQEGIKVHATADKALASAVRRLYDKGLLTQVDGGYLTDLGREAAEHAQAVLAILTSAGGGGDNPL